MECLLRRRPEMSCQEFPSQPQLPCWLMLNNCGVEHDWITSFHLQVHPLSLPLGNEVVTTSRVKYESAIFRLNWHGDAHGILGRPEGSSWSMFDKFFIEVNSSGLSSNLTRTSNFGPMMILTSFTSLWSPRVSMMMALARARTSPRALSDLD